ncbi:hypothetical protein NQ315_012867 [Exocentrus adspersus]|uniref:Reverse transcriptase domain-containing protein n=1 Tax=Exocentrus adspersus TaxID=1586481 RepID=A0AAV8VGH4_9CUCU|nr:hypothetical protein NQ315_012867 [Exocentrus adspersus]
MLSSMIRLTLQKTENRVKLNNRMSEEFEVRNSVRQEEQKSIDSKMILARNKKELKEVLKRLEEQSVERGLRINEKKTKYMEWTEEEIRREGKKYEFEKVEQFAYLGSIFSRKPNIGEEIEARIMAGNRCVAGLQRILRTGSTNSISSNLTTS